MKSPWYLSRAHSETKKCDVCGDIACPIGLYLEIPDNPLRQKWICGSCYRVSKVEIISLDKLKRLLSVHRNPEKAEPLRCPPHCHEKPPRSCKYRTRSPTAESSRQSGENTPTTPLN
jgi:hypothetical protein